MPAAPDDLSANRAETISRQHEWPGLGSVLDLPRPFADRMGAADAERNFRMIAQVDQASRVVDRAAAPALRRR
jgi:hypothetical protein